MTYKNKLSIGGQAVINGVMMKSPDKISMSVRLLSGKIENECWYHQYDHKWYMKAPIIRGFINFIVMIILGYKCLIKSAEKTDLMECYAYDIKKDKDNQIIKSDFKNNLFKILFTLSTIIGVLLSVFLFMWVPSFLVKSLGTLYDMSSVIKSLLEGVVKILIFVIYITLTSLMGEMKTLYQYHGAEHKSIACYEAGEDLLVKNIKKYSRFHPRCGTSFILIVLMISILIFSVISWESLLVRVLIKLSLMPVVIGVAYEVIRLTARSENRLAKILVIPGLWLQRITTKEPDDKQIEVAIDSLTNALPRYSK